MPKFRNSKFDKDVIICPSKPLKDAPLKRVLGWLKGTIEITSGKVSSVPLASGSGRVNVMSVRILKGKGPNGEPPGTIVQLPADMTVAVAPRNKRG